MLGSTAEADDAVAGRLAPGEPCRHLDGRQHGGWLTTVVARVCLDHLRRRRSRREDPIDVHIPDPIVTRDDGDGPEDEALLADSVGLALLVVLETLQPAERVAFVLHDMFAVPFDEIAPMLDRSPAAVASWPAGLVDGSRARSRLLSATWDGNGRWSMRSSPRRARVTSTGWSRSSTRTWSSGSTAGSRVASRPWSCEVPRPSQRRPAPGRPSRPRPSRPGQWVTWRLGRDEGPRRSR